MPHRAHSGRMWGLVHDYNRGEIFSSLDRSLSAQVSVDATCVIRKKKLQKVSLYKSRHSVLRN